MAPTDLKDLEALQRECHNMEFNRKSFAEEGQLTLRKQQKTLEKLRREKETLKQDIATVQANFSLKPMTSSEQAGVAKLFSEIGRYNELAEADRRSIASMSTQILTLSEQIGQQRKNMGGVNAAKENQRMVEKHVRLLENRVDQALIKFNMSLAQNRNLRQEIDDLRGERVAFQEVHKKLEKELHDQKKRMAQVIEQSNAAYEHRDKAQLETVAIEQADRKEQYSFEHQMAQAGRMLEGELLLSTANRPVEAFIETSSGEVSLQDTTRSMQHVIHANVVREQAQQIEAQLLGFEGAFREIEVASGKLDTDEIVRTFIANEEHIFSLYTYANEQSNEIKKQEGLWHALRQEESRSTEDKKKIEDAQERLIRERKSKIEANEKLIEKISAKLDRDQTFLNGLKAAIQTLFFRLKCKSEVQAEISMTESSMFYFLGIIEQRTNEILSMHYTVKSLEKSACFEIPYEEDFNDNDSLSPTCQRRPATRISVCKAHTIATGPVAPMGMEQISVNPPKLTDCSSDDGSADEDGSTHPLTRHEIQSKTETRANRLVARRNIEGSKGGNNGRRGSPAFHERQGRGSRMRGMGNDGASSFRASSPGSRRGARVF